MANNPRHKENLKNFPKGVSGNPKGRPKLPDLKEILAEVLGTEKNGKTGTQRIIDKLQTKAEKGDIRAAELIMDRGYGKVKTPIDVTTLGEKITQVQVEVIRNESKD